MGAFTNDYWWFLKSTLLSLMPDSLYNTFYEYLNRQTARGSGRQWRPELLGALPGVSDPCV